MRCAGVSGKMKNACVTAHTLHTSYGLLVMKAKIKMQYINIIILTISFFLLIFLEFFQKKYNLRKTRLLEKRLIAVQV